MDKYFEAITMYFGTTILRGDTYSDIFAGFDASSGSYIVTTINEDGDIVETNFLNETQMIEMLETLA